MMEDKYGYFTVHDEIDVDKVALCEKIFSNCNFSVCKYTVIIPEYRRPKSVRETILSAVNQDYQDEYEVLITSDGIAPEEYETESIVKEIAKKYNNISYYRNRQNVGMFQNWNNCIVNAKGEWIVVLPDDDLLSPYFLSTIDSFICSNNYQGMIGSIPHKIYGKEKYSPSSFKKNKGNIRATWIGKFGIFFDDGISVTGMTFDKKSIIKLGGFHGEFYPVSDSVCMINYAMEGKLVKLHCDISAYRIDENISQSEGVLERIVLYGARMKETVSKYDKTLSWFYNSFKKEIIYDYILGAENTWKLKINKDIVEEEVKVGFNYSVIKYYFMKLFRKMIKTIYNC